MSGDISFILDFDSTLVRVETLELMAELTPDGAKTRARIREITDAAMGGRMDFQSALKERLAILHFHRDQLPKLIARLQQEISPSFLRNRAFLTAHADHIYVVTSGFREMVEPVIKNLGLKPENLRANTLRFDAEGFAEGCDWSDPLHRRRRQTQSGGCPQATG